MTRKKRKKYNELTRAELEVMQVLWKIEKGFMKDIVEAFPEPRPAYTTIATIVHTLENKKFVGHRVAGKSHCYFPKIKKEAYKINFMERVLRNFFNDSPGQVLSFFAESGTLSLEQYDELHRAAQQIIEKSRKERENQ